MDLRPRDAHWPVDLPNVAIVGAGHLGRDLAAVTLRYGYPVTLVDTDQDALGAATKHVEKRLRKLDQNGLLHAGLDAFKEALTTTTELADGVGQAGVAIEAVPEDGKLKHQVLAEMAAAATEATLVSTTRALPPSELVEASPAAERTVVGHFISPPAFVPLVEMEVPTGVGADHVARARALAHGLGKTVVTLAAPPPGAISVRVQNALLVAAARAATDVDRSAIDAGFRAAGFHLGPFEVMDLDGLDSVAETTRELDRDVPEALGTLVEENKLGRRTGEGWYTSDGPDRSAEPADPWPLMVHSVVEAARLVQEGIAPVVEVDRAVRLGGGFPAGPLAMAVDKGLDDVKALADDQGLDTAVLDGLDLPEGASGIEVLTNEGITLIRILAGQRPDGLTQPEQSAIFEAADAADGPVVICSEGRFFLHPRARNVSNDVLEALRRRESVALLHGPLGDGAMGLARACRRRVARIDATIGTDRPVPAVRAVELELVDAVGHPAAMPQAIASVLMDATSATEDVLASLLWPSG